jgi:hypothetical protein
MEEKFALTTGGGTGLRALGWTACPESLLYPAKTLF